MVSVTETTAERVVMGPSGGQPTDVVVVVNAKSDPALAAEAREGRLNQGATPLAQTFVYHDPDRAFWCVVVPSALGHRFHTEAGPWLQRAQDPALPDYVQSGVAVWGQEGLRDALAAPPQAQQQAADTEAEAALDARQAKVVEAEAALKTERSEVEAKAKELHAIEQELAHREEALEARFERLREREKARLSRANPVETADVIADVEPADGVSEIPPPSASQPVLPPSQPVVAAPAPSEVPSQPAPPAVEEEEEEDESETEPTRVVDSSMLLDPDEVQEVNSGDFELEDDAPIEDMDGALLEEVIVADEVPNSEPPDDASLKSVLRDVREGEEMEIEGAIPAPEPFVADASMQMVAEALEEGVRFYVRMPEGDSEVFANDATLLVQYVAVEERPVVLLSLTDFSGDRPYPRRAAFDPRDEADRKLLETVQGGAAIQVALYTPSGRYRREVSTQVGERAANMGVVFQRADAANGTLDAVVAMERALAAAPPVQMKGHPYVEGEPATDAKAALSALRVLEKWAAPEKRDLVLLAISVPHGRIEAAFERILQDAQRFGLALDEVLLERAVEMGLTKDRAAYVLGAIDNFRATAKGSDLAVLEIGKNWEQLLEVANQLELSVDADAHEQAQRQIAKARGDSLRPPAISEDDLGTIDEEMLLGLVDHPRRRLEVALELVRRGNTAHLEAVSASMRKMQRDDVLSLVEALLEAGEGSAGALIDGLGAKKTFVRQACALGLGQLRLRRSVGPLVQLLQTEPTEVWEEVAWVIGGFGSAAVRNVERAIKNPKGEEVRLSTVLAHMLIDSEKALDGLNTTHAGVMAAVESAKSSVDQVRTYREGREGEPSSSATVIGFSQAFFQKIAN